MQSLILKAVIAGVVGSLVMSAVGVYAAPMMGMERMNPADMLAGQMGGSMVIGWLGHLMVGAILAVIYALLFASRLPGPPAVRGAIFSLAPWLMAQLLVMPMMGMPVFSGSMSMAMGSLIGHVIYGLVIGGMIGEGARASVMA
jgi:uncharacterized membrane protein YagU involved in acid resistance